MAKQDGFAVSLSKLSIYSQPTKTYPHIVSIECRKRHLNFAIFSWRRAIKAPYQVAAYGGGHLPMTMATDFASSNVEVWLQPCMDWVMTRTTRGGEVGIRWEVHIKMR